MGKNLMMKTLITDDETELDDGETGGRSGYAARLIRQGKHRFFTLAVPSAVLAATCVVDSRANNPIEGFQRVLDAKRAQEIADYIDMGFGTIPCSIVLSAQPEAELKYTSRSQVLSFKKHPRAFLILDGQHRVYGFHLAKSQVRVPVVIYNNLSKAEEARLFIDINTKQRPVPNELLLDIKRMAATETDMEALMHDVFDQFADGADSALRGKMSSAMRQKGKVSRVTFNAALRAIWPVIGDNPSDFIYQALNAYLNAWIPTLDAQKADITNSTLLRAMFLLFPSVAERVADRHGQDYTVERFNEILVPFFSRLRKAELRTPGSSPVALYEFFKKAFQTGFAIGQGRSG